MNTILENDSRNIKLNSVYITKSDLDIQTINSLNDYAMFHKNHLVLIGGYAVEAHLGGTITRAHGDIDCVFVNLSGLANDKIFSKLTDLLSSENTDWKLEKSSKKKIEWREKKKNIPFNEHRRLEVHIHQGEWNEAEYTVKKLINSKGVSINVYVEGLYLTLAEKIHKLYVVKDGVDTNKDRESSLSDFVDLAKLLALKEIDKLKVIESVSKILKFNQLKGGSKKSLEEYEYILSLLEQMKPIISKHI